MAGDDAIARAFAGRIGYPVVMTEDHIPAAVRPYLAGTGPLRIPTSVAADADAAATHVAQIVADAIRDAAKAGRRFVLGLPTGQTPVRVYRRLIAMHQAGQLSFRHVITFNLDEYHPMARDDAQSYWTFMHRNLFDHVDLDPASIHIPRGDLPDAEIPAQAAAYERAIRDAGGIDLMLLGIGGNGHIGFNEPGSPACSRTRQVRLAHSTRRDAAKDFGSEDKVPTGGVSMGVATILACRRVVLLALGAGKASAVAAAVEGTPDATCPASFLQSHPDTEIVCDQGAASRLTITRKPWLAGPVAWTEKTIRAAVIDVAESARKPLLALTVADYQARGLNELLDHHGPADRLNLETFRQLTARITGWPGGKPPDRRRPGDIADPSDQMHPKTVLVFSPHPDDDAISLGGIISRLVEQGHRVHIAYQTAGHRAVHEGDLDRHLSFIAGACAAAGKTAPDLAGASRATLKALVRRTEAATSAAEMGVPAANLHFLDSPLYTASTVGDEDARIHIELLRRLRPNQIYAAGDLADPNGTHRRCLEALARSLRQCAGDDWFATCSCWLYRGAWDDYGPDQFDRAVPLAPGDVLRKRQAILRHQSQKDRVLFPGDDDREFWQRAEDRNRALAERLDRLGLPQYVAIEALARWNPKDPT